MGWNPFKDVAKAIKKVEKEVKKVVKPPKVVTPPPDPVVDILAGKDPEKAIKDAVKDPIEKSKEIAGLISEVEQKIIAVAGEVVASVDAAKADDIREIFRDFARLSTLFDAESAEQTLVGIEKFIDTGNISYLHPIFALGAAEIERIRAEFWDKAMPIPPNVVAKMPNELQVIAHAARYAFADDLNNISVPAFAAKHKSGAIVMKDIIFFKRVPGSVSNDDLHYWVHELQHVYQYSVLGVHEFVQKYLGEELSPQSSQSAHPGVNALEAEADIVACRAYWIATPRYISACP